MTKHKVLGKRAQDAPLYQQLAVKLRNKIERQEWGPGFRLPPVREMADQSGLSRGTVKQAYDALALSGYIYSEQGRGTFVCEQGQEAGSAKEQALQAIDQLFARLRELGFSYREAAILIDLQQRQRENEAGRLQIGLAEDSPEMRNFLQGALAALPAVEIHRYRIDDLEFLPKTELRSLDAMVTTSAFYRELALIIGKKGPTFLLDLQLTPASIRDLMSVQADERTAFLAFSKTFLATMGSFTADYFAGRHVEWCLLSDEHLSERLAGVQNLLVPANIHAFASSEQLNELRAFSARGGRLIDLEWMAEHGAFVYLRDRIEQLAEQRLSRRELKSS